MKIIRLPLARIAKIIRVVMGKKKNDEKWKKIDSVQVFNEHLRILGFCKICKAKRYNVTALLNLSHHKSGH